MIPSLRKLGWLFHRGRKEAELQEELQFHLDEEANERAEEGVPVEEAHLAARRDLGNIPLVKEETRDAWGWTAVEQLFQDVRYALRSMAANRSFTALAVLSLALGIGANTAIFSFMDSILLRALPVPDPQSLVAMTWHTQHREMHGTNFHNDDYGDDKGGLTYGVFAYPAYELFQKNDRLFSSTFAYQGTGALHLTVGKLAEVAHGEFVSGEYFNGVGIAPAAGRLIVSSGRRSRSLF